MESAHTDMYVYIHINLKDITSVRKRNYHEAKAD